MKIALVIDGLARGGAERQVIMAAAGLRQLGETVDVITYCDRVDYEELVIAKNIKLVRIQTRWGWIGRVAVLAKLLRSGKYDVVHGFKTSASLYAWLALWGTRRNRLFFGCRNHHVTGLKNATLLKLLHPRPTGWIVNSASVMKMIKQIPGDSKSPIHIARNGIDPDAWNSEHSIAEARGLLGIDISSQVVTIIAQLRPEKNHQHFLAVAAELSKINPETIFSIVGQGRELSKLCEAAENLKIMNKILWLGERKDIPLILKASSVIVLTSVTEGLPNVLIEAAAAGVPAVSTDNGGATDIIDNDETGYIVPVNDVGEMANRINSLLQNDDLRRQFGIAARKKIQAQFSANAMACTLRSIYQDSPEEPTN